MTPKPTLTPITGLVLLPSALTFKTFDCNQDIFLLRIQHKTVPCTVQMTDLLMANFSCSLEQLTQAGAPRAALHVAECHVRL